MQMVLRTTCEHTLYIMRYQKESAVLSAVKIFFTHKYGGQELNHLAHAHHG